MSDYPKQNVQWFPGHMAKTRRLMKESLSLVDAVAEILDARIPESSRNPEIAKLIGQKPRIILLNKCDLADQNATRDWMKHFEEQGFSALAVDCRSGRGINQFRPLVCEVLKDRIAANIEKGMPGRAIRVMVVGIPNTGKSSFINRLAGKNKAKVADKPGVTRKNQWFDIGSGVQLLDTPGVLWPKFEDPKVGDKLAFTGSVKDEIMDIEAIAQRLLGLLKVFYTQRLCERYGLADIEAMPNHELLEMVAIKRGMLLGGGVADTERAAVMLLDEYRGGKLGRISLEQVK